MPGFSLKLNLPSLFKSNPSGFSKCKADVSVEVLLIVTWWNQISCFFSGSNSSLALQMYTALIFVSCLFVSKQGYDTGLFWPSPVSPTLLSSPNDLFWELPATQSHWIWDLLFSPADTAQMQRWRAHDIGVITLFGFQQSSLLLLLLILWLLL